MPKGLVIVESEAKAKTIASIAKEVGVDYEVVSTGGPLRDLPQDKLGFELEGDFEFAFEIPEDRKAVIEEIVKKAEGCPSVFLLMDLGTEGELQAWHAQEVLQPLLPAGISIKRARATEMSLRGMRQAFRYAGVVDVDMVASQKTRRAMDRLVMQNLTPLLWQNVQSGLALGRLQAQALNIICSREHERETTIPLTRWRFGVRAVCQAEPETEILFRLVDNNGNLRLIADKDRAPVVKTALSTARLTMDTVRRESITEEAPPPFTTETLLEEAAGLLGLSPGQTQVLAQVLYEGVDLGSTRMGLITMPYTEETRVSESAQTAAEEFIQKRFGSAYVKKAKGETVTFGRLEAIRPVDPSIVPETLQGKLPAAELRLYMLIWRRFMASQMAPALIVRSTAEADAMATDGINGYQLHAVAESIEFSGHRVLTKTITALVEDIFPADVLPTRLPALSLRETLKIVDCVEECSGPVHRPRYTEAELVRMLASEGMGRPATFASMIATNYQRKLIERQGRYVVPTELGRKTIQWMFSKVPRLINTEFAATAENALDDIAQGRGIAKDHIGRFNARLQKLSKWEEETGDANPEYVEIVLESLKSVVNWRLTDPDKDSDIETDLEQDLTDEYRVDELRNQVEEGGKLTIREYEELLSIFCRYRPQITDYVSAVKKLERYDLLEIADNIPDQRIIQMKMDWVAKAPLSPESKKFVDSLMTQAERGRKLTEAQIRVLDEILSTQARHIEGLTPEIIKEMGIVPRTQKDLDLIQKLLDALSSVTDWRPPSTRGKRVYDDSGFAKSVREQFEKRGDLSPAQMEAVKRMVARYHDKIANYAELVPVYGLPPEGLPQPTIFGRRSKKKKEEVESTDDGVDISEIEASSKEGGEVASGTASATDAQGEELGYDDI